MSTDLHLINDDGSFNRSAIMRTAHEWTRRLRHMPNATFASQLRNQWRLARKAQRTFYAERVPTPAGMRRDIFQCFLRLETTASLKAAALGARHV